MRDVLLINPFVSTVLTIRNTSILKSIHCLRIIFQCVLEVMKTVYVILLILSVIIPNGMRNGMAILLPKKLFELREDVWIESLKIHSKSSFVMTMRISDGGV